MSSKLRSQTRCLLVALVLGVLSKSLVATPIVNDNQTAASSSASSQQSKQRAVVSSTSKTIDSAHSTRQDTTVQPHSSEETDPKAALNTIVNDNQADITQLPQLARAAIGMLEQDGVAGLEHVYDAIHDKVVRDAIGGAVLHTAMQNGYQETFEVARLLRGEVRE